MNTSCTCMSRRRAVTMVITLVLFMGLGGNTAIADDSGSASPGGTASGQLAGDRALWRGEGRLCS